jgi:two-component system invasion response regulator UvrY
VLERNAGEMGAHAAAWTSCLSLQPFGNNLSPIRTKLGARTDTHLVWIAVNAGLASTSDAERI